MSVAYSQPATLWAVGVVRTVIGVAPAAQVTAYVTVMVSPPSMRGFANVTERPLYGSSVKSCNATSPPSCDTKVRDEEELEELLGLPVIGRIPAVKGGR